MFSTPSHKTTNFFPRAVSGTLTNPALASATATHPKLSPRNIIGILAGTFGISTTSCVPLKNPEKWMKFPLCMNTMPLLMR